CRYGRTAMRQRSLSIWAALGLWAVPLGLMAQDRGAPGAQNEDARPATSNVRGAQFPRVHADLRVTFQVKAPDAKKVQLQGGTGLGAVPFDLTRDEGGVWSVTTPPAVPGFHYYWFLVDGA